MASSMYQDGLLHSLYDVLSSTVLGTKQKSDIESKLASAARAIRANMDPQDPIEVAYWNGHQEVLRRFCSRDKTEIPTYFHPRNLVPISKFVQGMA
jgi:hypothetical protein